MECLKEWLIFFPDQGDQQMVSMDRLRLTQEWNEVSGYWKPSGVWLLLQVLQPFEQEEELPVSVREIWFDLRTIATFPEETGVWTFGSQFNWHIFVSELIQELRSVVRGLVPFEQQMEFICYDTVDIQNEEFPCLGGNAGENASLVVALNNPILLIPGDHSLLVSSSDERCADESLSHIATENMSTAGSRGGLRNSDTFSLHKSKNAYYGSKNLVLPIGKNCGSPTEASESEFEEAIDCSRLNKRLTRKNKGAGKVSKPVDLEAAACNALLQGHQKRKQKRRKDKQTNAGCGEFDIPNEEFPCLGSNAGENASLVVALNNPIILTTGDQSLLDSSSDERCTDESLSHIATENMSTEGSRGGLRNSDTFSLHKSKNAYCGSKNLVLPIGKNCGSTTEASESEFEEATDCSRSNNRLARKSKGTGKSSKPVDVGAAACNTLLQGHQKRKQMRRKVKQTNAGCGEFVNTKSHQNSASFQQAGQEGLSRRSNCQRGGSSRPEKISNYKESSRFKDVKLFAERYRKSKRRKLNSHTILPSVTLGDRKVKHSSTKSSGCEKSKRKKECQAMLRQGNELGNCLSPHETEPRKRLQQSMLQTYSQHVARTVLSELLDNDIISLEADVSYIRKKDGKVLMEGQITRDGIKCKCCKMVYTPSNFEAHAGSTYDRPAVSIFLQDSGKSLLECKMKMVQSKKPKDSRRCRMKVDCSKYESDTVCTICDDGGNLLMCDHCPSSFHLECVGLESVPKGEWFCPSCRCGACGMSEFNSDTEQFTEKTILYCDQCEREYHVGCMRKRGDESLSSCPAGNWFCSEKCSQIFLHLRQLLGISKPTSVEGLSLTILRSGRENGVDKLHFDAAIRTEHDSKLCVALNVLHECFVTITEPRTQSDFVADLLFNRESELRRLNFYGFYTVLLEKGDELVSVATFRVYGNKVAEMPLVGTRVKYRNQGMCRLLVNEVEKLLSELEVESLVLPAVPQLLQTWTSSFGFSKMTSSDRLNLSEYTILYFQETTMCQKLLKKRDPTVLSKPKGQFKKLMDIYRSSEKGDSELYNSASEADGTVEPINALPSVHTDQFNQTSHQIEAEHSPISTCTNPIQQTEREPGQNDLEKVAPPKFVDSNVSVDASPILALMAPTNIDPKILKKCYKRVNKDNSIREQHTVKNMNTGAENSFKYVYRRRMSIAN